MNVPHGARAPLKRLAWITILVCLVIPGLLSAPARAVGPDGEALDEEKQRDMIHVGSVALVGRVVRVESEGIEIEPHYGTGEILLVWEDIEQLMTVRSFRVLYGRNSRARGYLLGLENGHLLVGQDRATATRVPIEEIARGVSEEEFENNRLTRLRTVLWHWSASLELGIQFESGGVDKQKINVGTTLRWVNSPHRFYFDGRYAWETQTTRPNPEQTTKNELNTSTRYFYDLPKRFAVVGAVGIEFDIPRGIDFRTYPFAGVSYRIFDDERWELDPIVGFGWVYENFTVEESNDYAAAVLGLQGRTNLPFGAEFGGSSLYLPGLVDPDENWLYRMELYLTIPIWDPLALKLRFSETYDNNPKPNVGNNKTELIALVSLEF